MDVSVFSPSARRLNFPLGCKERVPGGAFNSEVALTLQDPYLLDLRSSSQDFSETSFMGENLVSSPYEFDWDTSFPGPNQMACRKAWAGSGPDGSIVGPACFPQRIAPDADACEEMTLREPSEVAGLNVEDASVVNFSWGDEVALDEFLEPGCCFAVVFIVVGVFHALNFGRGFPLRSFIAS